MAVLPCNGSPLSRLAGEGPGEGVTTSHQELYHMSRIHVIQFTALFAALLALFGGVFAAVKAQGQECRDIQNITICADEIDTSTAGDLTIYQGSVKIGPVGKPAVVLMTDTEHEEAPTPAVFVYNSHPVIGTPIILARGRFHLRNEPSPDPLVEMAPEYEGELSPQTDLIVDPLSQRIYNADAELWRKLHPSNPTRNALLRFGFISRTGIGPFFTADSYPLDTQEMDFEFDLRARVFKARVPMTLRQDQNTENIGLKVYTNITIDEQGRVRGTLDDFKMNLAGFVADVRNVSLRPAANDPNGAEFEAASVDVRRVNNPDMPALDAENRDLLFRFERLKYRNGKFSIGGGAVGIGDWDFGGFKLVDQMLGMGFNEQEGRVTITISSTLAFDDQSVVKNSTRYPITVRTGVYVTEDGKTKPFIRASLEHKPELGFGPLTITPGDLTLVVDPRESFYGLASETVSLRWSNSLGSQQGGAINGFRLGLDNKKDLVFGVGGGTITLPEARSKALSLTNLNATIGTKDGHGEIAINGTAELLLPGNSGVKPGVTMIFRQGKGVCVPVGPTCKSAADIRFTSFGFKVAGFTFEVENPRGVENGGGFGVDKARLKLPQALGNVGMEVKWLKVNSNGDVSLQGGGFELPSLKVGGFEFASLRGLFAKLPDGGYEFRAHGVMPMPGLDPENQAKKIGAGVYIRTAKGGDVREGEIELEFATDPPGIPIGGTGMELMSLKGKLNINRDTSSVKLNVVMRADSQLRIGGYPLVKALGEVELQAYPSFYIKGNARLTMVIYELAKAEIGLGAGQGFQGGWGFNAKIEIDLVALHANGSIRVGRIKLADGRDPVSVAIAMQGTVGIEEDQFYKNVPPWDITLTDVAFKGGYFNVKNKGQLGGVLGSVGCCFGLFEGSVFLNLSDLDLSLVNADDYSLVGAQLVRQRAAMGMAGYRSQRLDLAQTNALGFTTQALRGEAILQETVPFTVRYQGNTVIGISYPVGEPDIRLQLPNGTILTEAMVDNVNTSFIRRTGRTDAENDLLFLIADAQPGTYTLLIDNAPAQYDKMSYTMNGAPTISSMTATCDAQRLEGLDVRCNGAMGGSKVTLRWNASDSDSPDARVLVGYAPIVNGEPDLTDIRILSDTLSLSARSFTWDLRGVASGSYRPVVQIEDGQNVPVELLAETTIVIDDQLAPGVPENLKLNSMPSGMTVTWPTNAEADIAGYEIGYALDQDGTLVYTRDLGLKEISLAEERAQASLWGLTDNQHIWVRMRSYDESGNYSPWSEAYLNTAWVVAPYAFLPLPEQPAYPDTPIEVTFAQPLKEKPLDGLISLRDAEGNPLPGQIEWISSLEGDQLIGLRFVPAAPLAIGAHYTVHLEGSISGVETLGEQHMNNDYNWNFHVIEKPSDPEEPEEPTNPMYNAYLPIIVR
jgi:hypothetical protein